MPRVDWRKQLAGLLLALLFISFTISGLILINVVFTIGPFTFYGQPIQLQVNVGFILILLALIVLVLVVKRK
jgi:uncharacterized membrane protein